MKKSTCTECGLRKGKTLPVAKSLDGQVDRVCVPCWMRLDYGLYLKGEE